MTDLVQRLRAPWDYTEGKREILCREAADEIKRLRAALHEIARIRTNLSGDFSVGSRQSDIARRAMKENAGG